METFSRRLVMVGRRCFSLALLLSLSATLLARFACADAQPDEALPGFHANDVLFSGTYYSLGILRRRQRRHPARSRVQARKRLPVPTQGVQLAQAVVPPRRRDLRDANRRHEGHDPGFRFRISGHWAPDGLCPPATSPTTIPTTTTRTSTSRPMAVTTLREAMGSRSTTAA